MGPCLYKHYLLKKGHSIPLYVIPAKKLPTGLEEAVDFHLETDESDNGIDDDKQDECEVKSLLVKWN